MVAGREQDRVHRDPAQTPCVVHAAGRRGIREIDGSSPTELPHAIRISRATRIGGSGLAYTLFEYYTDEYCEVLFRAVAS